MGQPAEQLGTSMYVSPLPALTPPRVPSTDQCPLSALSCQARPRPPGPEPSSDQGGRLRRDVPRQEGASRSAVRLRPSSRRARPTRSRRVSPCSPSALAIASSSLYQFHHNTILNPHLAFFSSLFCCCNDLFLLGFLPLDLYHDLRDRGRDGIEGEQGGGGSVTRSRGLNAPSAVPQKGCRRLRENKRDCLE